jgi:hypothetical protein
MGLLSAKSSHTAEATLPGAPQASLGWQHPWTPNPSPRLVYPPATDIRCLLPFPGAFILASTLLDLALGLGGLIATRGPLLTIPDGVITVFGRLAAVLE